MRSRWGRVLLVAALAIALPAALSAQQPAPSDRPAPKRAKPQTLPQSPLDPADELSPAQVTQAPGEGPKKARPAQRQARVVACSGPFAKDSNHLKLATAFGPKNVEFTEVGGPDGTKLMASVVFPNDPKWRLEVLWNNEAARSDTTLIVITGQSAWSGPKGLRLGLALAGLEKLNGKPFRLKPFGANGSLVADWDGGALDKLAGDCKVGVRLTADPQAPGEALNQVSGEKELVSSDTGVRAVKPKIAEIVLGYSQ